MIPPEDRATALAQALLKYQTAVSAAAAEYRAERTRITGAPGRKRAKSLDVLREEEQGLNQKIPFYEQLLRNPESLAPEYARSIAAKLPAARTELAEVKALIAEREAHSSKPSK